MDIPEKIQLLNKVKRFLKQHGDLFDQYEQNFVLEIIEKDCYPADYRTEGVREILDMFNLIPKEENIYDAFLEEIKNAHGIEGRNIIEVGGGPFINLAKRISLEQQKGTITVYDPRLTQIDSTEKLILKKEYFTPYTKVENADLLIGLMPCKGAEALLSSAEHNKKDFILWLCEGGPHGDYFDYYEDDSEWIDSMRILAMRAVENENMGKLKIKYLKQYSTEFPIIYNEK